MTACGNCRLQMEFAMSVRGNRSGGHRATGCLLVPHMYAGGDLVPRPTDSSTARHTVMPVERSARTGDLTCL